MVQVAIKIPQNWQQYSDPHTSTLNPHNQGFDFYVYGTLPLILNKYLAVFAGTDSYGLATLQGRAMSGLFDLATIVVIYQLALLLSKKSWGRLFARFSVTAYACAALPIQLGHFFAVDSFATFLMSLSLLQMLRYSLQRDAKSFWMGAIAFGLALASKINVILILPLLFSLVAGSDFLNFLQTDKKRNFLKRFGIEALKLTAWLAVSLIVARLTSINYFESPNILDFTPNKKFVLNLQSLKGFDGDDSWFPPAIQWIGKPKIWYSVKNLVVFGYGIVISSLAVIGLGRLIINLRKKTELKTHWQLYLLVAWAGALFLYQSLQFVQAIRYFIVIYPILALLSGLGLLEIWKWTQQRRALLLIRGIVVVSLFIWPLAFISIYHHPHSRVAASVWIHNHIPNQSLLAFEYWDDPLPISVPGQTKHFIGKSLHVFDRDTATKWHELRTQLRQADYYILSSNRAWGSIMAVPEKYPLMSKYYRDLFADKTDYQLVTTFTSYPSLRYLGIPIDFSTDSADESFTVYDHPKVMIFVNKDSQKQPEIVGYDSAIIK